MNCGFVRKYALVLVSAILPTAQSSGTEIFSSRLKFVEGLDKGGVFPNLMKLENSHQNDLTLPRFRSETPLFATLVLGNGELSIAVDPADGHEQVFIDLNIDGDLTNDGVFSWEGSYAGEGRRLFLPRIHLTLEYPIVQNGQILQGKSTMILERYNADEAAKVSTQRFMYPEMIIARPNCYREGVISLKDGDHRIVVCDVTSNGLYNDPDDGLVIDVDHDGRLSWQRESPEFYSVNEPFNIKGFTYKVHFIDASGSHIELTKSETPSRPRVWLEVGALAPDFSAEDIYGNPFSLSGLHGKIVLLNFWATWCRPCVAELPALKAVYQAYRDGGFEILGLNYDADIETVRKFVEGRDLSWPQIHDHGTAGTGPVGSLYRFSQFPSTFLIDRDGKILAKTSTVRS